MFYLEHDTTIKKNESNIRLQVFDFSQTNIYNQFKSFFSFHFNIIFVKENFLLLYMVLEILIYNKDHLLVNYSCNMDEIHCRFLLKNKNSNFENIHQTEEL
jgi:hypothetical protein